MVNHLQMKKKKHSKNNFKFLTIQAVNTDYEMDAFVTAFIFLEAKVWHGRRKLRDLTVQKTRQPQLFQFFYGLDEPAKWDLNNVRSEIICSDV